MPSPAPSVAEQRDIDRAAWLATLSRALREAVLDSCHVRRLQDGEAVASGGAPAPARRGGAAGAPCVTSGSRMGKAASKARAERFDPPRRVACQWRAMDRAAARHAAGAA